MSDTGTRTKAVRNAVIQLARKQLGCHYLWGAAGAMPGLENGAAYRRGSVRLHANDWKGNLRDHGRRQPIVQAAYQWYWNSSRGKRICYVCSGRCSHDKVKGLVKVNGDEGRNMDHQFLTIMNDAYRWPRPDGTIDNAGVVYGQGCVGIRHFDCIGLINWVLSEVVKPIHYGIPQFRTRWVARDVGFRDVWMGDILMRPGHIGIASGPQTVIHAKGRKWGVVEEGITADRRHPWRDCWRIHDSYWMKGTRHNQAEVIGLSEADGRSLAAAR